MKITASLVFLTILGCMPSVSAARVRNVSQSLVSGPDPFLADSCSGARDGINYVGDVVEPYAAVSKLGARGEQRFIVVYQQDRWNTGGARGIMSAWSHVNKLSWHSVPLPFSACAPNGDKQSRASNAWVSIGPDGIVYAAALTFDEHEDADGSFSSSPSLGVSTSTDGGETWRTPVMVVRNSADKDAITADPSAPGTAYLVWNGASGTVSGHLFSKGTDGGRTWTTPVVISHLDANQTSMGGQILVDSRRRTLVDVHELLHSAHSSNATANGVDGWTVVSISTDGGNTWSTRKVAKQRPMGPLHSAGNITVPPLRDAGGMPSGAIDPSTGEIYAVWQDARFTRGRRAEIVISASKDSGRHWSTPHLVDPLGPRREFDPQIAVSATGTVAVAYYAMRGSKASHSPLLTQCVFTASSDQSAHFQKREILAGPFDMRRVPRVDGYFVGDYAGLVASGTDFLSVFVVPGRKASTELRAFRVHL